MLSFGIIESLIVGWRRAVVSQLQEGQQQVMARVTQGQQPDRARDACALLLTSAAQCYIRGHMCDQFVAGVVELQKQSAGTVLVLQQLCRLYLLYHATAGSGHLLRVSVEGVQRGPGAGRTGWPVGAVPYRDLF
ncbi:Acyl-CoA oxidase C-terminal [Trinorchestia longiramus]|nr:Acyl-CoA oxidase C-terminal [Trinorchestia longiramus]